jgi:hypothetical protein
VPSGVATRLGNNSSFWEERGIAMTSPSLKLIDGGVQKTERLMALRVAPRPRPRLTRRPGDHVELHSFECGEPLAKIRAAARSLNLDSETALALAVERSLICTDIEKAGAVELVEDLDNWSAEARPKIGLWSAHSSYLHHLLGLYPVSPSERSLLSPRAPLPTRLIDRVGAWNFTLREDPGIELSAAVHWEIAALLAGETMTEWAFRRLALR